MKIATIIVRSLLGLAFVVFGLNIFLQFMPAPPQTGLMADFGSRPLFQSKYIYAVGALQVVGGALLLSGFYVPLGLTLLGPVIVNILLTHICLEPKGLPIAIIVSAMALFLLWSYRSAFAGLLRR